MIRKLNGFQKCVLKWFIKNWKINCILIILLVLFTNNKNIIELYIQFKY
jgi:hypothetical protein